MGEVQAGAESREPLERGGHRGAEAGEGSAAETWGPMEVGAGTRERVSWRTVVCGQRLGGPSERHVTGNVRQRSGSESGVGVSHRH